MDIYLIAIVIVLAVTNLVTLFYLRKKSKQPELTKDANQLLGELLQGGAVAVVQVANPSEIFMYSPKDIYK